MVYARMCMFCWQLTPCGFTATQSVRVQMCGKNHSNEWYFFKMSDNSARCVTMAGSTMKTYRTLYKLFLDITHVSERLHGYILAYNHSNWTRKCLTWSCFVALIVAKRIKSLAQLLHAQISVQTQQLLISSLKKNRWKRVTHFIWSMINWLPHFLQRKGAQICDF